MRIITAFSSKGGVGKTTTLMALASAGQFEGMKVALIDTDQNLPLTRWRESAIENGFWSENVSVEAYVEFAELYEAVTRHEESGSTDLLLIDPRGGRSEFHNALAQIADFMLIPSRPVKVDADEVFATFEWLETVVEAGAVVAPHRLLFSAIKTQSQMTADMTAIKEAMMSAPHMKSQMFERAGFLNMQTRGLLGEIVASMKSDANVLTRGQARAYEGVLQESRELLSEIFALIDENKG